MHRCPERMVFEVGCTEEFRSDTVLLQVNHPRKSGISLSATPEGEAVCARERERGGKGALVRAMVCTRLRPPEAFPNRTGHD